MVLGSQRYIPTQKSLSIPPRVGYTHIVRAPSGFTLYHESCLTCQHFISVWLEKLKPNKLSTGCQNQLKEMAAEKATNPGRLFLFFVRMHAFFKFRRSVVLPTKPCSRQNRHATNASMLPNTTKLHKRKRGRKPSRNLLALRIKAAFYREQSQVQEK